MLQKARPLIVEFNGLPGCGKTTTAKFLKIALRDLGYRTKCYEEITRLNIKLALKQLFSKPKCAKAKYLWLLMRLACLNFPFGISRLKQVIAAYTVYINYKITMESKCDYEILIVDQGIVQSLISIVFLNRLGCRCKRVVRRILEFIYHEDLNILIVNCVSTTVASYNRILNRGLHQGRFDYLSGSRLLSALQRQADNFTMLHGTLSNFYQIDLAMDFPAELNSNHLARQIIKREHQSVNSHYKVDKNGH